MFQPRRRCARRKAHETLTSKHNATHMNTPEDDDDNDYEGMTLNWERQVAQLEPSLFSLERSGTMRMWPFVTSCPMTRCRRTSANSLRRSTTIGRTPGRWIPVPMTARASRRGVAPKCAFFRLRRTLERERQVLGSRRSVLRGRRAGSPACYPRQAEPTDGECRLREWRSAGRSDRCDHADGRDRGQ